jgi:hypothetical protein
MHTHFVYIEFLHMRQLHVQCSQLRLTLECFEHYFEPANRKNVVVAFDFLREAAET